MTLYTTYFFLEDFVPEPRLEFTLPEGGCCDIHGVLTTTKEDLHIERLHVTDQIKIAQAKDARMACPARLLRYSVVSRSGKS